MNYLPRITRYSIYALVLLLPLFILPFGGALGFQKQLLLLVLTMVGLASFTLNSLIKRKVRIRGTFLNSLILILILVLAASTLLSWDPAQSFFGPVTSASTGFLTWLCLAVFFFLGINTFDSVAEAKKMSRLILGSALVTGLIGLVQAWNVPLLPWKFAQEGGFSTVGRFNSLALFMAALLPLTISMYLKEKQNYLRMALVALGALGTLIVLFANYWIIWISFGVGMATFLVFLKIAPERINNNWIILPLVLLVIAFSFALIKPALPGLPNLPLEVSPSYGSAFEIGKKVITGTQGRIKAALGTGPGTFTFLYDSFRPKEISKSVFWAVNFQNAPSQILEMLGTTGILGIAAMLSLIIGFGSIGVKEIVRGKRGKFTLRRSLQVGLFAGWLVLVAGKFLYPASISLRFLFWLFMTLFMIITFSNRE